MLSRDGVGGTGSEAELVQIRHWVIFFYIPNENFPSLGFFNWKVGILVPPLIGLPLGLNKETCGKAVSCKVPCLNCLL